MKTAATLLAVLGLASAANAGGSLEALSLGTLVGGQSITGDTTGAMDNLEGTDGFVLGGTWTGGDDVYSLNWAGGDLVATLDFITDNGDIDLYVWGDDGATDLLGSSEGITNQEVVEVLGLAAGKYWIMVDGWLGATNTYTLSVNGIPSPASAALLGLGGLVVTRRRRA
ncbi:MAG: hypothetical protein JKY96_09190 [Phycisphaerales bacterium]|nr:hypothetical protein [Phycisphaerales bacterium]